MGDHSVNGDRPDAEKSKQRPEDDETSAPESGDKQPD